MNKRENKYQNVPVWVLLSLIAIAPCLLLICFPLKTYSFDWLNSVWQVQYFSDYIKAHHSFPSTFDTIEFVGMPFPIFYGYLLYPVLGVLSLLLGAQASIVICAIGTYFLLSHTIFRCCLTVTKDKKTSLFASAFLCWSLYPLTNLYHRSALPEFFATQFLFISLNYFILLLREVNLKRGVFFCLSTVFALGVHPITSIYGAFAILISFFVLKSHLKSLASYKILAAAFVLIALVLAPWFYAVALFHKDLSISNTFTSLIYHTGLDSFWGRLLPVPIDYRSFYTVGGVPDFHASVSLGLIALFLLKVRGRTSLKFLAPFLLFVFTFALSISPAVCLKLNSPVIHSLQFSYRLTTYITFFLFVSFLSLYPLATTEPVESGNKVLTFLLLLSLTGVLWKQVTMLDYFPEPVNLQSYKDTSKLADTFYGRNDYIISKNLPEVMPSKKLDFSLYKNEKSIDLSAGDAVGTNIYAFPWNELRVSDHPLDRSLLFFHGGSLGFKVLEAGTAKVSYQFSPDPIWKGLRQISLLLFGLLIIICIINAARLDL